jgi:phosphate transport system permease protein
MQKIYSYIEKIIKEDSKIKEKLIVSFFALCGIITILITIGIVSVLLADTINFFRKTSIIEFFSSTEWTPLFFDKHYGILPLLLGTLVTSFIAMIVAVPIGLTIAIYLSEYAPRKFSLFLKPILEILASIPTVIYGFFALIYVTPALQLFFPNIGTFNALSAGIVMGIMIIPYVTSLSEDSLRSLPNNLRESAYALGSTRLQTAFKVMIPAASSGITVSVLLAVSRALGETMIVAIAAGQEPRFSINPLNAMETISTYIVQVSMGDVTHNSIEYQSMFAAGMMLFIFTFLLNNISLWVKGKLAKKYEQ